jgi:hypothetical protein
MVTVVPVNAELTGTATSTQRLAAGVPVLLSLTITEYVSFVVREPVENEEEFCPATSVAHTGPLYHWYE